MMSMQRLSAVAASIVLLGSTSLTLGFAPPKSSLGLSRQTFFGASTRPSTPLYAGETSEAASQNIFGVASDAVTGAAFSLLHAFDDCGIEDSSKNLRVLWVRALLNQKKMIQDDVAETLLPKSTRSLVTTEAGASLFDPILQFTEWIQARTEFIDTALERFLASPVCTEPETGDALECNVVLFGAGYDTRSLRYRHRHDHKAHFVEVDLPAVVEGKSKLYKKFQQENDPTWDLDNQGPKLVPLDLNDCGGDSPKSLIQTIRKQGGLKENVPTFFVWEAVLFYINDDAVRNIMADLIEFSQLGGNGPNTESVLCFTDSLKPFVDVPFTNEARTFFDSENMDLLEHRSRWGGAVHFAVAATRGETVKEPVQESEVPATETKESAITGRIGKYFSDRVGGLVNSYTPTQANNQDLLTDPSFENAWYAIGYPWQIDGYENAVEAELSNGKPKTSKEGIKPFATRLWGEPLVIYRDSQGQLVALADVCPHRSAPLSMGTVEDGQLTCFYHGWRFGQEGACTEVPTMNGHSTPAADARYRERINKANCQNHRAIVEHEGIVFVWRGNVLEADPSKLPTKRKGDMETIPIDSVLDYSVDYSYIVENNLDSPHLFYLHDGSVPPIEGIGLMNQNLAKLQLSHFQDDCGFGHLGRLGKGGRPKKLIRFDPPNIVRHGGVSGFEEEFHCIPIAPHRTRVLIRQHIPKGPILSTITSIPYMKPFLTALVNSWNYHIGLEDAVVMQGQANRIEDWGAPRMLVGGLGDDLIKRYWNWRDHAHDILEPNQEGIKTPWKSSLEGFEGVRSGIRSGTSFGDEPAVVDRVRQYSRVRNMPMVNDDGGVDASTGQAIGSWGIKQNYVQDTPAAAFPPMNYKPYKNLLVWDDLVKKLFAGKEPSSTMIKTTLADINSKTTVDEKKEKEELVSSPHTRPAYSPRQTLLGNVAATTMAITVSDAMASGSLGRAAYAAVTELLPVETRIDSMNFAASVASSFLHN